MCENVAELVYAVELEESNINSDILSLGKVECVNPKCNYEWHILGDPSIILNDTIFICNCGYRYYSGMSKGKSGKQYLTIYYDKGEKK